MSRCITPINVLNKKTGRYNDVPCGRCWPCIKRRADGWAFRILQEKKRSRSAHFVTLTYDDAHVPINEETMQLTLDRKAVPLYMKRLRKLHDKLNYPEKKPLKYYAVGEYGEKYNRPHYHLILFNALPELIPLAWAIDNVMLGMVDIGKKGVTAGGARYLAEYMMVGQIPLEGRVRPFSLMSKHLGDNYLTVAMKRWHLAQTGPSVVGRDGKIVRTRDRYYAISDGYKVSLPRYYRDKIFPKIYRDIDVPLITASADARLQKACQHTSFFEQALNHAGLIETHKSVLHKKIKSKAL